MNILFLDDCPQRTKKFKRLLPMAVTCETAQECIDLLPTEDWDYVFLDHDLGGETYQSSDEFNTGMQVVRYIVDNPQNVQHFVVHSLNYGAALNMVSLLREREYIATKCSFLEIENFIRTKIYGYLD
jgi:DNA-binding NarL/FixJ family response regulator